MYTLCDNSELKMPILKVSLCSVKIIFGSKWRCLFVVVFVYCGEV